MRNQEQALESNMKYEKSLRNIEKIEKNQEIGLFEEKTKNCLRNIEKIEKNQEIDDLSEENPQKTEELSLAELFKRKKAKLAQKLDAKKDEKHEIKANIEYKARTKEELLKLRKEMMRKPDFLQKKPEQPSETLLETVENSKKLELMQRLAMGIKPKVDKREMKALNNKNYEKLPEVLKKKKQDIEKEEFRKRQENKKKLEMVIKNPFFI